MKKIILSLAAVFAFGAVSAQNLTSSKGEPYLPQAGDWSIGFNASKALTYVGSAFSSGGDGSDLFGPEDNFQTPGLIDKNHTSYSFTGRKFISDNEAIRYTANFNINYNKVKDQDASTQFGLVAGYGKEWRKGSTRLQGFYGADALVGFGSFAKKTSSFKLGAEGFIGAEYFVFPKVALGAQYSYGVFLSYDKVGDSNTIGFNLGNSSSTGNVGVGTASVLLNVYF